MIRLVNRGVGQCRPLQPGYAGDRRLSAEQQQALRTILGTPDQVLGLRGGAGTGKTRLLLEVVRGVEARQPVTVLAPSTAAVEALRKAGLPRAATVQRFLADASFREETRGHVLLVDEASLLSTRDMLALLGHVQSGGRLILSGDTRQHTGIAAGDALRLLEERSGLRMARVHASAGRWTRTTARPSPTSPKATDCGAYRGWNDSGWSSDRNRIGTRCWPRTMSVAARAKSTLLVSPTWREIEAVTQEARARLKAEGLLGSQETRPTVHQGSSGRRREAGPAQLPSRACPGVPSGDPRLRSRGLGRGGKVEPTLKCAGPTGRW
ncbi:MAG: AAA family ATPase [Verrucomicrobiales bacterium]|nr:AAA family ATPase [Verrucomicrobiales bacterium]